jgi:hypothetical protein
MKLSLKNLLKFLASLKLAVIIIISISITIATGTIIESKYDATVAKSWVYGTWIMYLVLGMLAVNLTAVMIDRWPWQKRHYPFVSAHIGILILLLGSWITSKYGLDGSMRIPIGKQDRMVTLSQTQLSVYSTKNGTNYDKLFEKDVNFFSQSLERDPILVTTPDGVIEFNHFLPFVLAERKVVQSSEAKLGSALRFQISNANVNMADWLLQSNLEENVEKRIGLAHISLGKIPKVHGQDNQVYLELGSPSRVRYLVISRDNKHRPLSGVVQEGQSFKTPWMGLELKILRLYPHAEEKWEFKSKDRPGPLTTSAVEFNFAGQTHSLQVDDITKIYTKNAMYLIGFGRNRIDLGFNILLNNFEVGHHQGTMMASSYKSVVRVPDGVHTIAMNEPMKIQGLTFYQSSFEEDPGTGAPIASILSVNNDPGRYFKYLGSLMIVLGAVWLILNKRKTARHMGPKSTEEVIG